MKTIFVATDFSGASRNACMYGAQLAQAMKARLVLFHAYLHVPATEAPAIFTIDELRTVVRQQLEKEAGEIQSRYSMRVDIFYAGANGMVKRD